MPISFQPFKNPATAEAYKRDMRIKALRQVISGLSSPTLRMPGREADAKKVDEAIAELAQLGHVYNPFRGSERIERFEDARVAEQFAERVGGTLTKHAGGVCTVRFVDS